MPAGIKFWTAQQCDSAAMAGYLKAFRAKQTAAPRSQLKIGTAGGVGTVESPPA